jgi:hypothetical protein
VVQLVVLGPSVVIVHRTTDPELNPDVNVTVPVASVGSPTSARTAVFPWMTVSLVELPSAVIVNEVGVGPTWARSTPLAGPAVFVEAADEVGDP